MELKDLVALRVVEAQLPSSLQALPLVVKSVLRHFRPSWVEDQLVVVVVVVVVVEPVEPSFEIAP